MAEVWRTNPIVRPPSETQQPVRWVNSCIGAVYFTDRNWHRGAVLVIDLPDASRIPALVEPWMLSFEADIELHPVMTPDDLKRAGLDEVGKKWI